MFKQEFPPDFLRLYWFGYIGWLAILVGFTVNKAVDEPPVLDRPLIGEFKTLV
ncbi:MAG: hypothetical protein FWG61_09620 [Firmicutes bacterium]|nr:hypothetical protein [Bacillota bacterium]